MRPGGDQLGDEAIERVGRHDNFFELGGTSLMAMQAAGLLEQRLGRRISARRYVFDSLGQLAAAYDDAESTQTSEPTPVSQAPKQQSAPRGLMNRLARFVGRN